MKYTPISFKSDYSLLKSLLKVSDIVEYATKNFSNFIGILDDNPYSIMDFYDKCEKNNVKCIFGMVVKIGEYKIYLYIENYKGYINLIKIQNLINEEKISFDYLYKYNEGLIVVLPYESYKLYNRLKQSFCVYHGYKNKEELKNAIAINKNVLFINEILCFDKKDISLLKVLYKIDGKEYADEQNYILSGDDFDLNTILEFSNKLNLKFDFSKRYIPCFCENENKSKDYLYTLARKGLEKRLGGVLKDNYKKRLEYELNVISSMGYVDYFLIVFDYVKYAKKHNILVGPGRGSAAGSLVSYSLGITEIDPIKYDLLFERFLNPERVTMPDIDIDFEDVKRGEVIDYVRNRYGSSRVALIVAYGTLGSRQVLRDVSKIMELDPKKTDEFCKKIDPKKSLKTNLKDEALVEYIKSNKLEIIYKISMRLEGIKKHTTIHAAGVVISSENLTELIPTFKSNGELLTGFTMEYLEKLGLLKMDFLALRNLTTIHNITDLIRKKDSSFNLKNIPLSDEKTFQIFKTGNTDNIFQCESPGMKNFLKKLEPSRFEDLVAANALFRPGPMQNIDEYVARRHGLKPITYPHPDLEPILKGTYGIIVYQEQIMQVLSKMGGYTFAEADIVRRAMSKKKRDVMEKEKIHFVQNAKSRGYEEKTAIDVYNLIVKFADYGFNKSHSVAYALIGYQMAYLKANYLEYFHLNTLNMNLGSEMKTKDVIEEAKARGLKIIKPDINKSNYEYVFENGSIILPLTTIKNIGNNISKIIVDNAPYDDFFDFFKKNFSGSFNKKTVETLIEAGAFDSINKSKNTLLENIDSALTYVELCKNLDEAFIMKPSLVESIEPDKEYSDIDLFGFYVDGHPASKFNDKNIIKIKNIDNWKNRNVFMVVLVDKIKVINTKKGEKMAFVGISDETGTHDAVIFPKTNSLIGTFSEDDLIKVKANVNERNGETQIIINEIEEIKDI